MNKGVLVWGYLASLTLLLGTIFMSQNLIAGKVLYLIGFFSFNLGYLLPLFFLIFRENQENKIGLVVVFGLMGFLSFLTGVSFFVVNWGGGIALIYTGGGILIFTILTIIVLSRRFYETHIEAWFPVLIFGVFTVVSLLTSMVNKQVMRVFTINNKESVEQLLSIKIKNKSIYNQLISLDTSKYSDLSLIYTNTKKLRSQTTSVNNYIESLKRYVIKEVEGNSYKLLQNKNLENLLPIQSNVEINLVNKVMLNKKYKKASELKNEIISFKTEVLKIIPEEDKWLTDYVNVTLKTSPHKLNKRNFNQTWEKQQFYGFPLVAVINQLSKLQMNINSVESEVFNYYYREALKLSKGNIESVTNYLDSTKTILSKQ